MTLLAQSKMTKDQHLIDRIAACAARSGVRDARPWAARNIWLMSAQPGWAEAYAAATKDDDPVDPAAWFGRAGADPTVITDEQIAVGVAAVREAESPPPDPDPSPTTETPEP